MDCELNKGGIFMARLNFKYAGVVLFMLALSSLAAAQQPVIKGISKVVDEQNQTIRIIGSNFGTMQPYSGDSDFLAFNDWTGDWQAGYAPDGNEQGLIVHLWTNSEIVLGGFTLDSEAWLPNTGDKYSISVWNPQSGLGTTKYGIVVAASN
jgi:hypothetical protein